jgi:hypothetical protein
MTTSNDDNTHTSLGIWYGCTDEDITDMAKVEFDQFLATFRKESRENPVNYNCHSDPRNPYNPTSTSAMKACRLGNCPQHPVLSTKAWYSKEAWLSHITETHSGDHQPDDSCSQSESRSNEPAT